MKRLFAFVVMVVVLLASVCSAESNEIKFRGIDWLAPEKQAKKELEASDGIKKSWYNAEEIDAKIDGWYEIYKYMYTDPIVETGGVELNYTASVAGYDADLKVSFMYGIKDGSVLHDKDSAMLYKAEYTIDSVNDIDAAYEDLKGKLASLYGEYENKSESSMLSDELDPCGVIWEDADGNVCWLAKYYNVYLEKYDSITIIYAVGGADEYLNGLKNYVESDVRKQESDYRQDNASNTDGL